MSEFNNNQNNDKEQDGSTHIRYCAICHRSEQDAGHLVDMPGGLSVCPNCMQHLVDAASSVDYQKFMDQVSRGMFPDFSGFMDMLNGNSGSEGGQSASGEKTGMTENPKKDEAPAKAVGTEPDGTAAAAESSAQNPPQSAEKETPEEAKPEEHREEEHRRKPTVSFVNLGDIFGNFGGTPQPKVKKKKKQGPKPVSRRTTFRHRIF